MSDEMTPRGYHPEDDILGDGGSSVSPEERPVGRDTSQRIEVAVEKGIRRVTGEHEAMQRPMTTWQKIVAASLLAGAGALTSSMVTNACAGWGIEKPYLTKQQTEAIVAAVTSASDAKAKVLADDLKVERDTNAKAHVEMQVDAAATKQALTDLSRDTHEIKMMVKELKRR